MPQRSGRPTQRFALKNGLKVILAPEPKSLTASVWVWYRVGSKNEWRGVTGASHWVEHMLFQGSPKYGKGKLDRAVIEVGGTLNAFTDTDFTAYFITVPRQHLAVPLDIESDRMTRARIAPEEVERERTVIRSEREGNENWPEFRVDEELFELAFRRHPYHWDPLGFPEDIQRLTAVDLKSYYQRFYGTKNAVLVIAGGFDPAALRREVTRQFSPLPEGGDDPVVTTTEPEQRGERRSELTGPGTTPFLEIGWKAPSTSDARTPATLLVDVILGGEARLFSAGGVWGRSHEHPSSRLYRALVDTGLAVRASSEYRPKVHPSLFTVHARAAKGVPLARLEETIDSELARLGRTGPTPTEMNDARTKIRRGAAVAYEGATFTGFRLGYLSMLGGPGFESDLFHRVLTTKASQVKAEARELFQTDRRSLVTYEPTEVTGGN
ncbi:MAG: insulinase family protein [Thermoplasmata archaeon]|nr:insulinase family protein [Thermoplasmata archaeon]